MKTKKHYVVTKALGRIWKDHQIVGLVVEADPKDIEPVAHLYGDCTLKGYILDNRNEWIDIMHQGDVLCLQARVRLRTPEDKVLLLKPKPEH